MDLAEVWAKAQDEGFDSIDSYLESFYKDNELIHIYRHLKGD